MQLIVCYLVNNYNIGDEEFLQGNFKAINNILCILSWWVY